MYSSAVAVPSMKNGPRIFSPTYPLTGCSIFEPTLGSGIGPGWNAIITYPCFWSILFARRVDPFTLPPCLRRMRPGATCGLRGASCASPVNGGRQRPLYIPAPFKYPSSQCVRHYSHLIRPLSDAHLHVLVND